jgi:ATP-dependent Lhr-like helicase
MEFSPDTTRVLETLVESGALFFGEIVKRTGFLPSRVEQALGELTAQGFVTSDSFEGLRAFLVPSEKRAPFADLERKRRHKSVTSVEYAGRWLLLRSIARSSRGDEALAGKSGVDQSLVTSAATSCERDPGLRDAAIETFARVLLRRYGVMFRRLLEREALNVSWYELGRAYRRLEARGEIRGGYFVSGVSGEQFALPEAIGLLRSIRKTPLKGELIVISGADPLNLAGILTPGPRVAAIAPNRILLRDGVPIAALEAGQIVLLDHEASKLNGEIENALRIGTMPVALRRYYG